MHYTATQLHVLTKRCSQIASLAVRALKLAVAAKLRMSHENTVRNAAVTIGAACYRITAFEGAVPPSSDAPTITYETMDEYVDAISAELAMLVRDYSSNESTRLSLASIESALPDLQLGMAGFARAGDACRDAQGVLKADGGG